MEIDINNKQGVENNTNNQTNAKKFFNVNKFYLITFFSVLIIIGGFYLLWYFYLSDGKELSGNKDSIIDFSDKEYVENISQAKNAAEINNYVNNLFQDFEAKRIYKLYGGSYYVGYIGCLLKKNFDEKIYNDAVNFIDSYSVLRRDNAQGEEIDKIAFKEYLKSKKENNETLATLILTGELDAICPEKLNEICLNSDLRKIMVADSWCESICDNLGKFDSNRDDLTNYLANIDWDDQTWRMKLAPYFWIASRYHEEDSLKKRCEILSEADSNKCVVSVDNIILVRNILYSFNANSCEENLINLIKDIDKIES